MTSSSPLVISSSSPTSVSDHHGSTSTSTPRLVLSPDNHDDVDVHSNHDDVDVVDDDDTSAILLSPPDHHRRHRPTEPAASTTDPTNGICTSHSTSNDDVAKSPWPRTPSPTRHALHHRRPRPLHLNQTTYLSPGSSSSTTPYSPRQRSPLHRSRSSSSSPDRRPSDAHDHFERSSSPYNTATPSTWPHSVRANHRSAAAINTPSRQVRSRVTGIHTSSPSSTFWPRKRYIPGTNLHTPAVNWPPPGFGSFLTPAHKAASSVLASPLYPRQTAARPPLAHFTPGPELDISRRSSLQENGLRTPSIRPALTTRSLVNTPDNRPAGKITPRPPSLVGWNEPFVNVKEKFHRMHESSNASPAMSSTALGKRRASEFDQADASDSLAGARRRESQIGPTDPVPQSMSRNKTVDGFVRPGLSPYQRETSSARTRTSGWAENMMQQTEKKGDSAEARVSLPGIKELFTMAGDVESGWCLMSRSSNRSMANRSWPLQADPSPAQTTRRSHDGGRIVVFPAPPTSPRHHISADLVWIRAALPSRPEVPRVPHRACSARPLSGTRSVV